MAFMSKKTCIFLSLLAFLTVGCVSSSKRNKKNVLNQEQIDQMDQALSFMKNKNFLAGAQIYDELARTLTDSSSKSLMLFNAGIAYKEAKECKKALSRFRKLLDRSLKDSSFKARGLIEISYIYECLGKSDLALFSLKDVQTAGSSLPWTLSQIVYPGRLAIAYAGLGQISKAENYKSLALTRILQSKTAFSSEKELNERVSRMFYLMGRSYVKKENLQPEAFFKAFSYHQLFLLQSLFLKDKLWSNLSQKELNLLFDKLNFALSNFKNKKKYKKLLTQSIESARILVKKEKSKKWNAFYSKKSNMILKLL